MGNSCFAIFPSTQEILPRPTSWQRKFTYTKLLLHEADKLVPAITTASPVGNPQVVTLINEVKIFQPGGFHTVKKIEGKLQRSPSVEPSVYSKVSRPVSSYLFQIVTSPDTLKIAGHLKHFIYRWRKLTSKPVILSYGRGVMSSQSPSQHAVKV